MTVTGSALRTRVIVPPQGEGRFTTSLDQDLSQQAAERARDLPRTARPRNEVWDALVEVLEHEPLTESERKAWGKIVRSLQGARADRDSILAVVAAYRREWPGCTLTVFAIEKWYGHFLRAKRQHAKRLPCPECGIGGGHHLADCARVAS